MLNEIITLSSGKKLDMSIQSFEIGCSMFKVLARELKTIKIKGCNELDFRKILANKSKVTDEQLDMMKDVFFTVVSCNELEALLFECFKKCIYDVDKKVDRTLFNINIEARSDYLEMAWEVGKLNLSPFLKNLTLLLSM